MPTLRRTRRSIIGMYWSCTSSIANRTVLDPYRRNLKVGRCYPYSPSKEIVTNILSGRCFPLGRARELRADLSQAEIQELFTLPVVRINGMPIEKLTQGFMFAFQHFPLVSAIEAATSIALAL